jgi:NDP-hexose 4-ketoreductase
VPLVAVLGARGFLGAQVVGSFASVADVEVVQVVRRTDRAEGAGRWESLDLLDDDEGSLSAAMTRVHPQVVVNCTGLTIGPRADLIAQNVVAVGRLLDALERSGIAARLIHLGSAAEYGPGPTGHPVSEASCPRPTSVYGTTKLAATQLVVEAVRSGRLEATVLRIFNPLGPGMADHTLPGAALRKMRQAMAQRAPGIQMGPLEAVRDFIDLRDIGAAVVAATQTARLVDPVVNIGSGTGHPVRDVVAAIGGALGFAGSIDEDEAGSPRSADVPWQVADVRLAAQSLGWSARHDLESAVRSMVDAGR